MKIIENWFIGAMLCVAVIVGFGINDTCQAAPPTAPLVGEIVTSAGPPVKTSENVAKPASLSSGSVAIRLTPIYLPNINSVSWTPAANAVISDAEAGTLTTNTTVALPTQYAVVNPINHLVGWSNLVLNTSTSADLDDPTVWILVDAQSLAGQNIVSLDSLQVTSASSPDGNYLGTNTTFTGLSYTPRAVAIQANGVIITNGPASQQGKRVLVLVQNKMFSASSPAALNIAQNWMNYYNPYFWKNSVQVIGDNTTLSSTTVSTSPLNIPSPFSISITPNGESSELLSILNASPNLSYQIWSSTSLSSPVSWQFAGLINGTNAIPITITASGSMFYRASVQ
jgi:hypothetical protein